MIIQCDNCQSKFRLDDSKLGSKGVKVKCTKCENIFIVRPGTGAEEPAPPERAAPTPPPTPPTPPEEGAPTPPPTPPTPPEEAAPTPTPPTPPSPEAPTPTPPPPPPPSEEGAPPKAGAGEFDFEQEQVAGEQASTEGPPKDEGAEGAPGEEVPGVPGPSDFEFDFSEKGPSGQEPEEQKDDLPGDFDFGSSEEGAAGTEQPKGETPGEAPGGFELDRGPLEGAQETAPGGPPPEGPAAQETAPGGPPPEGPAEGGEEEPPGGFELGFEEEKPVEEEGPAEGGEGQPSGGFELGFEEEKPVEEEPGEGAGGEDVVKFSIGEKGEEEGEGAPSFDEESPAGDLAEEEKGFGEEEKSIQSLITKVEAHQKAVRGRILYFVLFLLVVVGAALGYYSGYFDPYLKRPSAAPAVERSLEILNLEGSFANNDNIGRVFVLSASVKNITDVPQKIEAVKGVIYNKAGERIKTSLVSPGWTVSSEELRTLTGAELKKRFEDRSAVSVRPNTTMPVMVVFTELPAGMAEAEIEIVR